MTDILKELEILKNLGSNTATARIQKTGRLGFSMAGIEMTKITEKKHIRIAKRKEEKEKDTLYLIVDNEETEGSFPVVKAGIYYYISCAGLFGDMGYDYEKETFAYRIKRIEGNDSVFKLVRYYPRSPKKNGKVKTV